MNTKGRVTIPTDMDAVPETLDLLKRWGADAIRDCDGTEFPQELKDTGAKIYATYYTTRKDNAWAKANPDETQQCYIMTPFYTAEDSALTIPLMTGISRELMKVNDHDDIARWWEVIDRTTGEPLDAAAWHYDAATESVVIDAPAAYHEYTVSFLAYLIWDPVHMYNSVINDWKDVEHQIPFDVRQPKTHAYTIYDPARFGRRYKRPSALPDDGRLLRPYGKGRPGGSNSARQHYDSAESLGVAGLHHTRTPADCGDRGH